MKKISLLILNLVLLSTGISLSQTEVDRNNFYDGVFFLAEEDYEESLAAFNLIYKDQNIDNSNLNYLIGLCYLKINGQKTKSIPYLKKAIKNMAANYSESNFKETSAPNEALMLLADGFRIDNQLDSAIHYYTKYLSTLKDDESYAKTLTLQEINACKRAKKEISKPYTLNKSNIGNLYNSGFNNFNPVISANGNAIAYMSEQRFYDAVFFVEITNGRWSNPINITSQIQSDGDQYVNSLSADGKTMFLSRSNVEDADIMVSYYQERRWTKSQNIGKPVNTKYFESHASISPDGKTLYFISNRKESLGGMDIFMSQLNESDNSWADPVNLGPNINTGLNEDSPVLNSDGTSLYFSSQGHESIGGYDVFRSDLNEDGSWSKPIRLDYPLNTTDDNIFFYPYMDGSSGYMARIEPEGLGGEDIYLVSINDEIPSDDIVYAPEDILSEEIKDTISEIVEEPGIQAEEIVAEEKPELKEELVVTDEEEVAIEEISPGPKYHIRPIFFGFDSYALSDVSKTKLKEMVNMMNSYPELNLKVLGHTDSKGPEVYNQYLSEQRCKAVLSYLAELGIENSRLEYTGYGEKSPTARNTKADGKDSLRGRQLNRRVEFKISVSHDDNIIIDPVEVPEELKLK